MKMTQSKSLKTKLQLIQTIQFIMKSKEYLGKETIKII